MFKWNDKSQQELIEEDLRTHLNTHTKDNSWWLNDAKGIPLTRVCDECIELVKDRYMP